MKREGRRRGGRITARGSKAVSLPDIKIHQSVKSSAIFFDPSNYVQRVGDSFQTSLMGYRPGDEMIEIFDLWIRYDPKLVDPVWVDLSPIEGNLYSGTEVKVWREKGQIRVKGRVRDPIDPEAIYNLAHFHWKALKPSFETAIELSTEDEYPSVILANGRDILKQTGLGSNLRVNARVKITPDSLSRNGAGMVMAEDIRSGYFEEIGGDSQRIRLAVITPSRFVGTGEVSYADIVLLNPSGVAFDELKFRIRYDPGSIKILDADEENYIKTGINIFDGDFHDHFPFDIHGKNEAHSDQGYIDYAVGSIRGPRIYPDGTLARIVYRMKRQAGQASFWFERMDPVFLTVTTDVAVEGRSLLGKKNDVAVQVLHGAKIEVKPLDLGV